MLCCLLAGADKTAKKGNLPSRAKNPRLFVKWAQTYAEIALV